MAIEKILIIDDDPLIRKFLSETLKRKKYDVETASSGKEGLKCLKKEQYDLVITDMKMPDISGLDVIKRAKKISPQTLVVVVTAFGSIENAVDAMHNGAFNYLIKPFSPDTIEAIISKAREHRQLLEENQYLRREVASGNGSSENKVVGDSAVMAKVMQDVKQVATSNANIFINGESGTGKEVIAQAVHDNSTRSGGPFIKVNCAAIPDSLLESEFFGHERGAFTGANQKRLGRFELANNGSLLLDEITEIPIGIQAKLLRAIQEQVFERVGGTAPVKVNVRLISTSNRNMEEAIAQNVIREDLYYRLNVVPINLPPLRERTEDIVPLANHFLTNACISNHKAKLELSAEAKEKLINYPWPGNVRELQNIIERAVVMSSGGVIEPCDLVLESGRETKKKKEGSTGAMTLRQLEKKMIVETLIAHENDKKKVAGALGITPSNLEEKMIMYKIEQ